MATATKRVTTAQMNWMLKNNLASEHPHNNGGLSDVIISGENWYQWIPPYINRDREIDGGFFEAMTGGF